MASPQIPLIALTESVLGERTARVQVVEYGDFECANCKQAATVLKMLKARYGATICIAYRHFPLEAIHPHALLAARAAEAAAQQGRFWEMYDALFAHQNTLSRSEILACAMQLRLDLPAFEAGLSDPHLEARIREQQRGAEAAGVRATPVFFVNQVMHDVSFGFDALYGLIERQFAVP